MHNHSFTFNGKCSDEFGLVIKEAPNTLSRSKRRYSSSSIPGRNGNLYRLNESWEEVIQSYDVIVDGEEKPAETYTDQGSVTFFVEGEFSRGISSLVYDFPVSVPIAPSVLSIRINNDAFDNVNLGVPVYGGEYDYISGVLTVTHDSSGNPLVTPNIYNLEPHTVRTNVGSNTITIVGSGSLTAILSPENFVGKWTEIAEWLYGADGYEELSNSFDPDHYMLAVCVDGIDVKNQLNRWGRATIKFRCRPERFLSNYKEINPEFEQITGMVQRATLDNPTVHIAKPLIRIDNNGNVPTLLNPTGATEITSWTSGGIIFPDIKNPHFYVGLLFDYPTITIDSSKINSYSFSNGYLTINSNTYRYGVGINTPVLPNTVYTFSTNMAQEDSVITLIFCDSNGTITDYWGIGGFSTDVEWTFKTPNNTRYMVFYFDNRGINPSQYNSLMLNTGETRLPFYFSNDTFSTYVQINDTIVRINDYFSTVFIDCETYDVRTPDVSLNQSVVLTRQMYNYTESSTAFPTITSGTNHIYTPINSDLNYSIKTRIWEI